MYKQVYAFLLLLFLGFIAQVALGQDSTMKPLNSPEATGKPIQGEKLPIGNPPSEGSDGLKVVDSGSRQHVEMADKLRADGKIYVVIAVLLVILAGLIFYVARLDRKISRLEKEKMS